MDKTSSSRAQWSVGGSAWTRSWDEVRMVDYRAIGGWGTNGSL